MQSENSYLQQPKRLLLMKNAMRHRRNTSNNDDEDDTFGNLRQHLPRRCKSIQPFYAIDLVIEEEAPNNNPIIKKKKGLGASSTTKQAQCNNLAQLPAPRRKQSSSATPNPSPMIIEKPKDKEEMNKSIPSTILSWLIEMKVVREQSVVNCLHETHKNVIGQGIITSKGILCCCCEKLFSVSNFPRHRGDLLVERPYENLLLGDAGVSLLTCQIEAWNKHSVAAKSGYLHVVKKLRAPDHHDDCCLICADGGDLMCCENCPSTYHSSCVGFKGIPKDDWRCPYCHCKYCDKDDPRDLLQTCFQCLKKYHWHCSELIVDKTLERLHPPSIPFCGRSCWMVYQNLEEKLGRSMPLRNRFSWTIVRRMDLDGPGQHPDQNLHLKANCNTMVVLAAMFIEQCFKAIHDRQTKINIAQSVVYNCGSNFTRINFSRFYTAILEFEGHIISAASLRIPTPKVAEIPFVATAERWRRKGMCTLLLKALESALADIGVEQIVIPSAEELVVNWQQKFGFTPLDNATKREIIKLNTLMFPGTTRLQKMIKIPTPTPTPRRIILRQDLNMSPAEEK